MPGQASEKTLQDIETLLTTIDTVLDNILTAIQESNGLNALTYQAPATTSYTASSSAQIVAANNDRQLLVLTVQPNASAVYLGIGNTAVDGQGILLRAGVRYHVVFGSTPHAAAASNITNTGEMVLTLPLTVQAVNAISASNQTFYIQEAE